MNIPRMKRVWLMSRLLLLRQARIRIAFGAGSAQWRGILELVALTRGFLWKRRKGAWLVSLPRMEMMILM
jgi:hypothetical protein